MKNENRNTHEKKNKVEERTKNAIEKLKEKEKQKTAFKRNINAKNKCKNVITPVEKFLSPQGFFENIIMSADIRKNP